MNLKGSLLVIGVSVMRRHVTARWRDVSGRSRNWSVHCCEVGKEESGSAFGCSFACVVEAIP